MAINNERSFDGEKASELFSVLAYNADDSLFLTDDECLAFGYICNPLSGADSKAADRINVLLNGNWPDDTLMQFNLFGGQDIHHIVNSMVNLRFNKGTDLTEQNTFIRKRFLEQGTRNSIEPGSGMLVREVLMLITVKVPISDPMPTDKEIALVSEKMKSFSQSLKTIGFGPTPINKDFYVHIMSTILNWSDSSSWRKGRVLEAEDDKLLKHQVLDYDQSINVDKDGLWLGEPEEKGSMRISNLSVKRFPKAVFFGSANSYVGDTMSGTRGLRGNFMISAALHFPVHHSTKSNMERKRQWAVNQAYGPMLKFVPVLAQKKHGFDVLFDAIDNGDSFVRLHMGITLFSKSSNDAISDVSNAKSYFGELGYTILEDKYFNLPLFLNRIPFGADRFAMRDTFRFKTMATRHAIPLLPLFSDWKGTGKPVMNFISRNGQLMSVDLFDSSSNYNCCIAAQSGSGKSFLANEMISNYLAIGGKVWAIDVGYSYKDLCEVYEGDFVQFNATSNICLNPFPLIRDYNEEEDMIVGLVKAMAAPTEPLSDFQIANLKKTIRDVWDANGNSMTIDDIEQALLSSSDIRVTDIGHQLYAFTKKGVYGKFFNGVNNVNFNKDFSVLELEELKGRTHLQQVVLLQLIYQIQQDMYLGDRDRPKIVLIDEAWSLLTEGDVAKFIEHGYRRFRKYGGAAVVITQSVYDLYNSPTGRAIAENSANMYLLGQKSEAISSLQAENKLPIGHHGYELLKTVHTEVGRYSEIFFITSYGSGIGRLIVDDYHKLLYSTHPNDVQAITEKRRQGLRISDAIKAVLQDRGTYID